MTTLLTAVLSASLLGSPHCGGMCGPLALVALSGTTAGSASRSAAVLYHGGRLVGYLVLGVLAALAGAAFDFGGTWVGVQRGATMLAGTLLIVFGLVAIARLLGRGATAFAPPRFVQPILQAAHRRLRGASPRVRAASIGALTVLLPCGWLYAFVIVAAGTAHPLWGAAVMLVFWAGTVPALVAVAWGARRLAARGGRWPGVVTAALFLAVGVQMIAVRARADLAEVKPVASSSARATIERIERLPEQRLPCCHVD